jgi:hypothetical protein
MENVPGSERRHLPRFALKAAALIQTLSEGVPKVFELHTRDISSKGAFFPTEVPLQRGEKVKVTLILSISSREEIGDFASKAKIITEGQVVRSTERGMAVEFGGQYTVSPVAV